MQAIVRDKDGKKIVQFEVYIPALKKMAKKLGLTFKQYMEELAKYHVEQKRKRKKNANRNRKTDR